jgi:hypothetical protein
MSTKHKTTNAKEAQGNITWKVRFALALYSNATSIFKEKNLTLYMISTRVGDFTTHYLWIRENSYT